jgi:hypothetical protein
MRKKESQKKIQMTNLGNNFIEEERLLHLLLNPPVGGEVCNIGLFNRAGTGDE